MPQFIEADVIQKIVTPAEWDTLLGTKIPYKGQIMLVSDSTGKVINIKVGDGTNNFASLTYMFDTIQANVNYVQVTDTALPTPSITSGFSVVGEGTYTRVGQSNVVVPAGSLGILGWNGTAWSLSQSVVLPKGQDGQGLLSLFDPAKSGGYSKDAQVRDSNGFAYVSLKDANTSSLTVTTDWSVIYSGSGLIIDYEELWPLATVNGFINTSGVLSGTTGTNWKSTGYIPVIPGQIIKTHLTGQNTVNSISYFSTANASAYKSGVASSSSSVSLVDGEYTVPSDCYFARISGGADNWSLAAPNLPHSARLRKVIDLQKEITDVNDRVDVVELGEFEETQDLWLLATIVGYINKSGTLTAPTDNNWRSSDFIKVKEGQKISIRLTGHAIVNNISTYRGDKSFIEGFGITTSVDLFLLEYTVPSGVTYIRLSGASLTNAASAKNLPHYANTVDKVNVFDLQKDVNDLKTKVAYQPLPITPIYTVCNDIITTGNRGRNRNYSQAVYLDHLFNGLTEEKNIRFKDAVDRVIFTSPMVVNNSTENTPGITFNGGVNVLEQNVSLSLVGNDIVPVSITAKHRSTLNSITSSFHPKVLIIGDSVTYGEMATVSWDNYSQNFAYHLMAKEMFMKDKIDAGNIGHDATFLGIYEKTRTFTYKGQQYTAKTHHEGIRGISASSYLTGGVAQFWDGTKFSIKSWVDKYRTLDNNGNRLTLGNGTGTLITASNLNTIDVCDPTHFIIALGFNNSVTLEQYNQFINTAKSEFPNIIIGIMVLDSAGTYFPSLHPNCDSKCTIWNDTGSQGSRHSQQYNLQKIVLENLNSRESENIYVIPTYYVAPTAEAVSNRECDLPDAEYNTINNNKFRSNFGWHASTHVNGLGHSNWGYALYSWLKYTIGKSI